MKIEEARIQQMLFNAALTLADIIRVFDAQRKEMDEHTKLHDLLKKQYEELFSKKQSDEDELHQIYSVLREYRCEEEDDLE